MWELCGSQSEHNRFFATPFTLSSIYISAKLLKDVRLFTKDNWSLENGCLPS